jgi:hypothetical protein
MLRKIERERAIDALNAGEYDQLAMPHRVLRTPLTLIVATVVASCSEDTPTSSSSPQASPAGAAETSPEAVAPLVGRWEQTHHCEDLVRAFDAAGLAAAAPSCEGKHPQLHFHFFTEGGLFGSLDKNGQQVDDGTCEIIDGHTFTIGDSTFRYTVTGGDTLTLEPVITRTQRRETLASPQDFTTGSWMVNVAYEGTTWKRVPCEGWC